MRLLTRANLYRLAFVVVVLAAIGLRASDLGRRPMHTDEAVHAAKLGQLLEQGQYRYDRTEFHGPTLNYLSLIPAWVERAHRLSEIDEETLRIVPAVFGLGLVLLLPLLAPGIGRPAVIVAASLTAVSPAMVFYSRYYIQEILLVFFGFAVIACGYRYYRSQRLRWALGTGVSVGLMHATKETSVLLLAAMTLALGLTLWTRKTSTTKSPVSRSALGRHASIALVAALAVSGLFYSSFLNHPSGVLDSYTAYFDYLDRAQHEWHIHPWHYYLGMLLFFASPSGPVWTESFVVILAAGGIAYVVFQTITRRAGHGDRLRGMGFDPHLARFLAFYTVATLSIYSAIPYKTPWNILAGLHGMILMAGIGAASMLQASRRPSARAIVTTALVLGTLQLARQSWSSNREFFADPGNPYVYAQTTDDVPRIAERIQGLADVHPDGRAMRLEVIVPGHDYWPLPWYLRSFSQIGWWDHVDLRGPPAEVVLATPDVESDLLVKLYQLPLPGEKFLYLPLFESNTYLRPTVELRGYVRKDLWDRYLRSQPEESTDG